MNEDQRDGKTAGLQIQIDKSRLAHAYALLRLGQQPKAFDAYAQVLEARREIYDRRPTHPVMMRELAGCLKIYGKSLLWTQREDQALGPLRESLTLMESLLDLDPAKPSAKRQVVECLALLGKQRVASGVGSEATELFDLARTLSQELFELSNDRKTGLF